LHSHSHHIIRRQVPLKTANTFGIDVRADYFAEISVPDDLPKLMDTEMYQTKPRYIIGGGSNILLVDDYPGLIIKNSISGISVLSENKQNVFLRVGAGVIWDHLVRYSLDNNWGGLENLSMIPGRTGAAPIQNIGAYGVEFEQVFKSLKAISLESGQSKEFDHSQCRFGYRDSIFKTLEKNKWIITSVTIKLDKRHKINTNYGNLKETLTKSGIHQPTIHDVSNAVRHIRSSKLPDPSIIGNAGSFFKNPIITNSFFKELRESSPDIPGYPADDTHIKIPAAWLIDQCGLKGKRMGDAGIHDRHALILVNHGHATGQQLLDLSETVQSDVFKQFGIKLEPEVNIIPSLKGKRK